MRRIVQALVFFILYSPLAALSFPQSISGKSLLNGKSISQKLNDDKRASVILFLSASCPCSHSHIEHLKMLSTKFPQINFVAIHSNQDEPTEAARDYFQKQGLPFEVIEDDGARIADEFKAYKTPHAFFISPKGKLLYQGGVSNSAVFTSADKFYLQEALQSFKEGKVLTQTEGRTLGCVISRRKH